MGRLIVIRADADARAPAAADAGPVSIVIRLFEAGDAEQVARLWDRLSLVGVETAESVRHRLSSEPARARRRAWVALEADEVVGFANAFFRWLDAEPECGHVWVGVSPERRLHGIGSTLWRTGLDHLQGAARYTTVAGDDPDGQGFVERRGFRQCGTEMISLLDPRRCRLQPVPREGFHVVPLREVRERELELFRFWQQTGAIPLGGAPDNQVSLEEWRQVVLTYPLLDEDMSAVVLDTNDRIVSLSWLHADRATGRAENEWAGTLPELRGHGLAREAKLASIRRAAEHGVTSIVTDNDIDNQPIRRLNHRLGYRELSLQHEYEHPDTPPPT